MRNPSNENFLWDNFIPLDRSKAFSISNLSAHHLVLVLSLLFVIILKHSPARIILSTLCLPRIKAACSSLTYFYMTNFRRLTVSFEIINCKNFELAGRQPNFLGVKIVNWKWLIMIIITLNIGMVRKTFFMSIQLIWTEKSDINDHGSNNNIS